MNIYIYHYINPYYKLELDIVFFLGNKHNVNWGYNVKHIIYVPKTMKPIQGT